MQAVVPTIFLVLAAAACHHDETPPAGQDAGSGDVAAAPDAADIGPTPTTGALEGRVLGPGGKPVAGVFVQVCTEATCTSVELDEEGRYAATDLQPGGYKLQVVGALQGYLDMAIAQTVRAGETTSPPLDLRLVAPAEAPISWARDVGGTVVVAGGKLELTAPPGALKFPFGPGEVVSAAQIDAEAIASHEVAEFEGLEAQTLGFLLGPFGVESTEPIAFRVLASGAAEGALFGVFVQDATFGTFQRVGGAQADTNGDVVPKGATGVMGLTALYFVPE